MIRWSILLLLLCPFVFAGLASVDTVTFAIPSTFCGDSVCNLNETCSVCSLDCGLCASGSGGSGTFVGHGVSIASRADRLFEYSFKPDVTKVDEVDVVFGVSGDRIVRLAGGYGVSVVPSVNGVFIPLDFPPKITILDGLRFPVVTDQLLIYDVGKQYYYRLPNDLLLSSGVYTSYLLVTISGRSRVISEEFEVRLSKDRLSVSKGREVAPTVSVDFVVSNEGDLATEYAVRYWLGLSERGSFGEGLQASDFTKDLVPFSVSKDGCSLSDVRGVADKVCSRVSDEILFEVPIDEVGPKPYWCKVETCRNWGVGKLPWGDSSVPEDKREVCFGGLRSQGSVLLNVRGLGVVPVQEIPKSLIFQDFIFSLGGRLWPSHYLMGTFLYLLIFGFIIYAEVAFGLWWREKNNSSFEGEKVVSKARWRK